MVLVFAALFLKVHLAFQKKKSDRILEIIISLYKNVSMRYAKVGRDELNY
jgi:hypothetical protein